ncbi:MAG TPA: hypothetical protein VFL14_07370 [Xanthomonadales bacterium]|nr:hypothetical protein [Xanthomonadales bacterium]
MRLRSFLACLLGLLLAAQPAFAAGLPRCAHHGEHASAAVHEGHHGEHAHATHERPAPKHCDCGCLGAMAGCAHMASTVAMIGRLVVHVSLVVGDAPSALRSSVHPSAAVDPPLRPPTRA